MRFRWPKCDDKNNAPLTWRWTSQFTAKARSRATAVLGRVLAAVVAALAYIAPVGAVIPTISNANTHWFKLGPLSLGMTNADVVKLLPLQSCSSRVATMECAVELTALGEKRSVDLSFEIATKKLRKIELRTTHMNSYDRNRPKWDDARLPQFFADLGIEPCPADMEQKQATYRPVVKCFSSSQQVRELGIRGYPAVHYQERDDDFYILIQSAPTAYRAFMKQKAETATMERRSAVNRARERVFVQGK